MINEIQERKLKLQQLNNTELVEGLGWALDQAINGNISGACFIIKHSRFQHSVGILGQYKDDPYCAMQAAKKLKRILKKNARLLEEHITI